MLPSAFYNIFGVKHSTAQKINQYAKFNIQKLILLSLFYLPNIEYMALLCKEKIVSIEAQENFVKSSFRNRCEIAGANGIMTLSIPVKGGRDHHQKLAIVKISNQNNWQAQHWQSIVSAYGSAPFFEHYEHHFKGFYEKEIDSLFEFNFSLLKLLLKLLKVNTELTFTELYERNSEGIVDKRNSFSLKNKEVNHPTYIQVFEPKNGFISNMSVLDLLFNCGPEAKGYLQNLQSTRR